jgi:tetratricopeptide (TPR) repeat protein
VDGRLYDLTLLERLDNARLEATSGIKDDHFDFEVADRRYRDTFRETGLDVEALPVEEAGARLRETTVAAELAAALDDWARVCRQVHGPADGRWKHLLRVGRVADPDPWRVRVREALEEWDGPALAELATSEAIFDLLPPTLHVVGIALYQKEAPERTLAFMREAQRRHPEDFWANAYLAHLLSTSNPPRQEEEIRFCTAAVALRPKSPGAHNNLGAALTDRGHLDEAIAEYREALRLNKNYGAAHANLGLALRQKGRVDEAIAECQEAIRLQKDSPAAHNNLGAALVDKGRLDEAIAEYREALRLQKSCAEAHNNLGLALPQKGQVDEAIAEGREAVRLKEDYAAAHNNLGAALADRGRLDEAIAEYHKALRLQKAFPLAHDNLGNALFHKGQLDEAIAQLREAISLDKDFAKAHFNLGNVLRCKRLLDEAITEYQEAVRLKNDYAHAHCNLGLALVERGQLTQALEEVRLGHELGSRSPWWPYPSAQWLRWVEQLASLDARLPQLLQGVARPADAAEGAQAGRLCLKPYKQLYAAAARFYAEAFAAEPKLANDLGTGHRYAAACAAALAGCGQGKDADQLDDQERVRLRRQALTWLGADLAAWRFLLEKDRNTAGPVVLRQMRHWQGDADLAGVRGPDALARLPEVERPLWEQLWQAVAELGQRAADVKSP